MLQTHPKRLSNTLPTAFLLYVIIYIAIKNMSVNLGIIIIGVYSYCLPCCPVC